LAVLIVEDEPWLSLNISEALEDEGYDVIAVAYADNAIEALEARNDIHTVFTDLDVRGFMDGLKLAAAVRERWPPVNIIVTTGNGSPRREEMPARALFIGKPYRNSDVVEAVRSFE
jgi:DNA-binding NtrC family response regulator